MSANVLLVVDGLGLSGKTKALVDLATGLDRRRFNPTVVSFSTENGPLAAVLRQNGVPVLEAPMDDGIRVGNAWRMAQIMRRLRPDVIHCYNPRAMLYGGLIARVLRIGATLGTLSAFACMVPDRHYRFLPQQLLTRTRRNRLRNRFVASLMQRIGVVSADLGRRFCLHNRIASDVIQVVPYGVRLGYAPHSSARIELRTRIRAELQLPDTDLVVASVGRLVEQKDYPTQLTGFAAAVQTEPRLQMLLIGDGPLHDSLQALAAKLGIEPRVKFLGYRADVSELLQAVDIFTVASVFEPYGVSVLEAKANGTPILASAVDEIPQILSNGASGYLFEAGSAASYAAGLLEMTRNPQLRAGMAERAYREAQEMHGLTAMIDTYQRLYDEILQTTHH
jgi:glycosyltransferase involved in cell wall biosynthesis